MEGWYYAGHHWPSSSALVFRAVAAVLLGTELQFFERSTVIEGPILVPITSLAGLEAVRWKARSPAWQFMASPVASIVLRPAVREFFDEGCTPEPILKAAARYAFFNLAKVLLMKFATYNAVHIPSGASLVDVLQRLVHHMLPELSAAEVWRIVLLRASTFKSMNQWSEEIGSLDEAMEVLDKEDEKFVKQAKKEVAEVRLEEQDFLTEYRKRVRERHAAVKPEKKGKHAAHPALVFPTSLPKLPLGIIDVTEARRYLPPTASVWRGKKYGSWQGHYKPYPRIGRSWNKYSEAEALRLVHVYLWGSYLLEKGHFESECPIKGIFDVVQPHTGAGSSID